MNNTQGTRPPDPPSAQSSKSADEEFDDLVEPVLGSVFGYATRVDLHRPAHWVLVCIRALASHFGDDAPAACQFLRELPSSEGWRFRKRSAADTPEWLESVLADERAAVSAVRIVDWGL